MWFQVTKFVVICYSSNRKVTYLPHGPTWGVCASHPHNFVRLEGWFLTGELFHQEIK